MSAVSSCKKIASFAGAPRKDVGPANYMRIKVDGPSCVVMSVTSRLALRIIARGIKVERVRSTIATLARVKKWLCGNCWKIPPKSKSVPIVGMASKRMPGVTT